ncbi:MAG: tRNA-dihydrouridine synthase family protein [Fibrobacter sp.]|nr:tRNA-dihydrouridine synthase family protein [Fibrobacter sp.]
MCDKLLPIHFAPLQGFTECAYRQAHFLYAGAAAYYTPFLRVEKGAAREKDLRDLQQDLEFIKSRQTNTCHCENLAYGTTIDSSRHSPLDGESGRFYNVIPQIICRDASEFRILVDAIQKLKQDCGFAPDEVFPQIDINMGCPFPMQAKAGRGSGILPRIDAVKEILQEVARRTSHPEQHLSEQRHSERSEESSAVKADTDLRQHDLRFSIKMRLGYTAPDECLALLPLLNDAPLAHITMHPRLGIQQYKGALDLATFDTFYAQCRHPLIFNGDVTTIKDIQAIARRFPNLKGIMIGRGLLANPSLAAQYLAQYLAQHQAQLQTSDQPAIARTPLAENSLSPLAALLKIHSYILENYRARLQGDAQVLDKIRPFWTYAAQAAQNTPEAAIFLPKRTLKRIEKARSLNDYVTAVSEL